MSEPSAMETGRYARIVESVLSRAGVFHPESEGPDTVQVERSAVFPDCVAGPSGPGRDGLTSRVGRLIELADSPALPRVAVLDRAGHRRPVYRPLLVYGWLLGFEGCRAALPAEDAGRWEGALRSWCGLLTAAAGTGLPGGPAGGIPAAGGAAAAEAAWSALALFAADRATGGGEGAGLAARFFTGLAGAQHAGGAWLSATGSDSPETLWYHELVLLHAAASYAARAEDAAVASAADRNAAYHLRETQPDHATNQPWGLFAFIRHPETRPLADQLLHSLAVQQPGRADGVSSILLADALYCLRLTGLHPAEPRNARIHRGGAEDAEKRERDIHHGDHGGHGEEGRR